MINTTKTFRCTGQPGNVMEAKHTKGEWICGEQDSVGDVVIWAKGTPNIAVLPLRDVSYNEQVANAKLIAAAPEMLKALQCISSFVYDKSVKGCTYGDTNYDSESAVYGYNMCLDNLQEIANNAIKKATE